MYFSHAELFPVFWFPVNFDLKGMPIIIFCLLNSIFFYSFLFHFSWSFRLSNPLYIKGFSALLGMNWLKKNTWLFTKSTQDEDKHRKNWYSSPPNFHERDFTSLDCLECSLPDISRRWTERDKKLKSQWQFPFKIGSKTWRHMSTHDWSLFVSTSGKAHPGRNYRVNLFVLKMCTVIKYPNNLMISIIKEIEYMCPSTPRKIHTQIHT